jgi:hypothetical protein
VWTGCPVRGPVDRRLRDGCRPAARCRAPTTRRRGRGRRSTRQWALRPSVGRARHHSDVPPPSNAEMSEIVERRRAPCPRLHAGSTGRERALRALGLPQDLPTAPAGRIPISAVHWNGCATNVAHYHSLVCRPEDVTSGCAPTRTVWYCRARGRSATSGHRATPRSPAWSRPLAGSSRSRPGACRGSRGGTG